MQGDKHCVLGQDRTRLLYIHTPAKAEHTICPMEKGTWKSGYSKERNISLQPWTNDTLKMSCGEKVHINGE